jgi:CHASE3 domain sensor protein
MEQNKQTNDFGAMTGIIVVIILLLIGAFYFAKQRMEQSRQFQNSINEAIATTSSDEVSDISADANALNVDNLGTDINNL